MSFLRRLFGLAHPPSLEPSQSPSPKGRIAASFREWAHARGFQVRANTVLLIAGRLAGRDVTVDPGLDGSHPGWVVVTIAVALPSVQPIFVTRITRTSDFATSRIRALFDDVDLGPELRAISVGPHYVRLRLAPGAAPSIVEHAVHAVGDAMRAIHASPESAPAAAPAAPASFAAPAALASPTSEPRHSCSTTVPYPS